MAKFSDVWAGQYSSYAKEKETGDIYAWGLNNYSQLGFNDKETRFMPERVVSMAGRQWTKISGGQHHAIALDSSGMVYALGRADYGRLGMGEKEKEDVKDVV